MTAQTLPADSLAAALAVARVPDDLARWVPDGASVAGADRSEEERPSRDALGIPGLTRTVRETADLRLRAPVAAVRDALAALGMDVVSGDAGRADLAEPPAAPGLLDDPFLVERRVTASVRGRDFPGRQRSVVETKAAALRREIDDPATTDARRAAVRALLDPLEQGLVTTLRLVSLRRTFAPHVPVADARASIGSVVPVACGTRLVYRVNEVDADAGREGEAEPMVFHVVALGAREVALLFTGGVHGFRHMADLDAGRAHDAWFVSRERVRTEATAPWVGRRVFAELRDRGASEMVVQSRRDASPVAVEKVGEDRTTVRVDGRPLEVPVFRCRTSRDDDMMILADADSPLVLRMEEAGAGLVRTIDAVHSPQQAFRGS